MQKVIESLDNLRNQYIAIGGKYAVEHEAKFAKEMLYVSENLMNFSGKHYGLYECFTVLTQHTYGTPDELLFILGVMSTHKEYMDVNVPEYYKLWTDARETAYALAADDTLNEMRRIGALEGVEILAESYTEAYDKYFDCGGKFVSNNYFYHYRLGKALFHECEIVSGILVKEV